ncbi:MAG: tautomerase family protein [Chloroflexota bacterium]
MAQIKIYGVDTALIPIKNKLSAVIHACVMDALGMPKDKRAHRFFPLAKENFFMPGGRTEAYTIIEITMIEGRTVETKKKLIRLLFDRIQEQLGIQRMDLEICILESPAANWGFRGMHGDEIKLNYKVNV